MNTQTITRKERKYVLTMEQYQTLYESIITYLRPDRNGINGLYTVTSLYFDNVANKIYHEKKSKVNHQKQIRLRVYDDANKQSHAFFEMKQHRKDIVRKSRITLLLHEAYHYLQENKHGVLPAFDTNHCHLFNEIDDYRATYALTPKMIINYDRHALYGVGDGDLRMTFDFNVRCRNYDLFLEHGAYGKACLHPDLVIMEIKTPDELPIWLTRALQELNCQEWMDSKYGIGFDALYYSTQRDGKDNPCQRARIRSVQQGFMELIRDMRIHT